MRLLERMEKILSLKRLGGSHSAATVCQAVRLVSHADGERRTNWFQHFRFP